MAQPIGNGRVVKFPCTPEQEAQNDINLQTQVDVLNQTVNEIVAGSSDHKVCTASDAAGDVADFLKNKVSPLGTIGGSDVVVYFQESTVTGDEKVTAFVKYADLPSGGGGGSSDHKVSADAADEAAVGYAYLGSKVNPIDTYDSMTDIMCGWRINSSKKMEVFFTATDVYAKGGLIYKAGDGIQFDSPVGGLIPISAKTNTSVNSLTGISALIAGGKLTITVNYTVVNVYGTGDGSSHEVHVDIDTTDCS